jgi:flagellar basal-body rod modification protein FlgD
MIPPTLAASVATSALGLISSIASNATSNSSNSSGTDTSNSTKPISAGSSSQIPGKEKDVVNQAEFMKLLVAQLQNQDPLNPLDSANFSAQLAQFSSLEQLTQINQRLADQAGGGNTVGRFEAVGFIGREVTGASAGMAVKSGTATTLDYTLTTGGAVSAKIINSSGQQIANVPLGSQSVGAHTFDLSKISGAPHLDDGQYGVVLTQASTTSATGTTIDTFVTGKVTGVDLTGDSPVLLLGDRRMLATSITEIKEASADTAQ